MTSSNRGYIDQQIQTIRQLVKSRNYEAAIHAATTFLGAIPDEEEVRSLLRQAKTQFVSEQLNAIDQLYPRGKEAERLEFLRKLAFIDPKNRAIAQMTFRTEGLLRAQKRMVIEERLSDIEKLEAAQHVEAARKALDMLRKEFPNDPAIAVWTQNFNERQKRTMEDTLRRNMTEEQKRLRMLAQQDKKKFRKI